MEEWSSIYWVRDINEGRGFGGWEAENQWFVFEHIKFKMPIGWLSTRDIEQAVRYKSLQRRGEVQAAYKLSSKVFLIMKLCGSLGVSKTEKSGVLRTKPWDIPAFRIQGVEKTPVKDTIKWR